MGCVSLIYRVEDAPPNSAFSTKAMDAHLEIFCNLWRLKRLDYKLSHSYVELREMRDPWWRLRKLRVSEGYAEDAADAEEDEEGEAVAAVLARTHFLRMTWATSHKPCCNTARPRYSTATRCCRAR